MLSDKFLPAAVTMILGGLIALLAIWVARVLRLKTTSTVIGALTLLAGFVIAVLTIMETPSMTIKPAVSQILLCLGILGWTGFAIHTRLTVTGRLNQLQQQIEGDHILIHHATWGPVNSSESTDVTEIVRRAVHGTKIDLPVTIGVLTDPYRGSLKQLTVSYSFAKKKVVLEQLGAQPLHFKIPDDK